MITMAAPQDNARRPATMNAPPDAPSMRIPGSVLERVHALLADGQRKLLGLVGPPGGGKSTLATALAAAFPGRTVVVPMDGFHLANAELVRLGRSHRKGAPDTFDSAGYLALLRRLRAQRAPERVYAPEFRREIEEPVAGAIAVPAEVPLVITEGNYLLLDEPDWAGVRGQLDEAWYLHTDEALRRQRLVQRHVAFGRSLAEATAWEARSDEANARRVAASAPRAQWQFRWDGG